MIESTFPFPERAKVLHDLTFREEPHALLRPDGKQPKAIAPVLMEALPVPEAGALPAAGNASPEASFEDGYQSGLLLGKQEGMAEGRAQGYKLGVERGLLEGNKAGEAEVLQRAQGDRMAMEARLERLDQLLASLPSQFNEHLAARLSMAEEDMVALSYTVICRFLGDKLLSREAVAHGVRQAIAQCCGAGAQAAFAGLLAIHVNPRDLEGLRADQTLAEWLDRQGAGDVPWVPDEQVQLGGSIIRSTQGSLDARLEIQLASLHEILATGANRSAAAAQGQVAP